MQSIVNLAAMLGIGICSILFVGFAVPLYLWVLDVWAGPAEGDRTWRPRHWRLLLGLPVLTISSILFYFCLLLLRG